MLVASTSVFASTALLPPPALGERRHRGLARRCVAVRRRAILADGSAGTSKLRSDHSPDGRESGLEINRWSISRRRRNPLYPRGRKSGVFQNSRNWE